MSDALALDRSNDFLMNLGNTKENTKKRLREEFNSTKLNVLKETLKSSGIPFDQNVSTIADLKKDLKNNLNDTEYKIVLRTINDVGQSFDELFIGLENGSTNSLNKFVNKAQKIVSPLAKAATTSLASRTALILAPTIASKAAVGGILAARTFFKLSKNKKSGVAIDKMYQCNKMLQEMEVTRNSNGDILDTRFNEDIQAIIRKFLNDKKINFIDSGYLSLREAIYGLDFELKKELCFLINSQTGNKIDVNERIEKVNGTFFDKLKDNVKKVLATGAAGVGAATAINSVDPAIMAGPVNGILAGLGAHNFIKDEVVSSIIGLGSGVATAAVEHLPVVGETLENIFATENLLVSGVAGIGAGVVGVVGMSAVNLIKGLVDKFNTQRDRKDIIKFDSEKYIEENKDEFKLMREMLESKDNSLVEQAGIDLIYGRMIDLGINVGGKPKNTLELASVLSKLNVDDKKKMTKYIGNLRDYNDNNYGELVNFVIKSGKVVSTLALLGLSGLSIYDIAKDGEFLPQLSAELFKEVPNNIYLMLPEKTMINAVDYKGEYANTESKVAMIADKDLDSTAGHYTDLIQLTKKEEKIVEIKQDIINDGKIFIEDTKNGLNEFLNDPVGTAKEAWNDAKKAFGDFLDKCGEVISNPIDSGKEFLGDTADKISDAGKDIVDVLNKEVVIVPDDAAIEAYIDGLSIEEQVNLAYYFNNSSNVSTRAVNYESIALALQKRLPAIQEAIEKYNQKMQMIYGTSEALTVGGQIAPIITEVDEQIKKVA